MKDTQVIKHLRIVNINFQSIRKKGKNIDVLIETVAPDIILGTETWLTSDICSSEFFNPSLGYKIYRNDRRTDAHGGVLIAVRHGLQLTDIETSSNLELISGTLALPKNKKLILSAYYRPPDKTDTTYLDQTTTEISSLRAKNKNAIFILGGDFNIPDISWERNTISGNQYPHRVSQTYLNIAHDLGLEQMVDFPTRQGKTLDLIFSSHPAFKLRCKALPPIGDKSDHDIVLYDATHRVVRKKTPRRKIYLWKDVNVEGIRSSILEFSTTFLATTYSTIDDMWNAFKEAIGSTIEANVPTKLSSTRYTHPWVNTKTRRLSRKKCRAYRKARATNRKRDWDRYTALKASTQKHMRKAHNNFIQDTVNEDVKQNPKRFWSYVKSKKQDTCGISPLLNADGFLHSDSTTKAEILNSQFQSVFTKEDLTNMPDKGPSNFPDMDKIQVTDNGVCKLLLNQKPFKASGPDGIPARILKLAAKELAPILTRIFQTSLDTGTVPSDWKEARITPLFKKGERNSAANYRPVSLTSIVSKILEHIIHSSSMKHLEQHNILCNSQHGFRARRSCESQLITTIQSIASALKTGRDQVDVILLDFAKAFDKVPHQRLLYKLNYYGIRGNTLKWISSFLSSRTQQVLVEGCNSTKLDVLSGVPQGTVLGPLLFLVYINDLPEVAKSSETRLFADDSLLLKKIRTTQDAEKLQEDLSALEQWETDWQMSFHPEKCSVIRVSTNRRYIQTHDYFLHGHKLQVVDSNKYLGVTLSEDLSWKKHVDNTTAKASRTLGFLRRNLRDCNKVVRETAYTTMVRPTLEYAAAAWDPYTAEDRNNLDKVQRRAARFVCNNYTDRQPGCVTRMVTTLRWEPLQQRREHHRLTMLFKILHGLVDIPEANTVVKTNDRRTRGANRLYQPNTTSRIYKLSFFPRTIQDWNHLPTAVTDCADLEAFKSALRPTATPLYHHE